MVGDSHPEENEVNLTYFLCSEEISSPSCSAKVTVLVGSGASGNFIDMWLAPFLGLDLAPKEHVLGASSESMQCAVSMDLLHIKAAESCFQEPVWAIPGLIYSLVVGVGWWSDHVIQINLFDT